MRKGVWEVPREGNKGGSQKREAGWKRALGMWKWHRRKEHEPCIGSEVKDSSDTFKSCRQVIK